MTTPVTYRKTKTGEWVAYGPASLVLPGFVTVTKKSGEAKQELVERVGHPFTAEGVQMVYGYLAAKAPATARPAGNGRGGICDECGEPRRNLQECTDSSGIGGLCCPRCASQPAYCRSFA